MKHLLLMTAAAALLTLTQSACSMLCCNERPEVIATYTATPIKLDGTLNDPAWQKTPAYTLVHSRNQWKNAHPEIRKFFRNGVAEPGKVRVLWDDQYLYVGMEFTDSDIAAEGTEDQTPLFSKGDTAEVFLKPVNKTWYWEMYVTPKAQKTAYFFKGRGHHSLPSCFPEKPALSGMKAAAKADGTVNNPWDKDKKWTAVIAIPISEINMAGEKLSPEVPWLIFFGRYNYGRYLPRQENSAFPEQEYTNYHVYEEYARLKMVR